MEFRELIVTTFQKKYVVMFFTSLIYILGLFSFFYNFGTAAAVVLLLVSIVAILKDYLSPKLVIFWYFVFVFAFFNANFRIKHFDELYKIAPQNATLTGQIVSIPNGSGESKTKFFFKTFEVSYNGKTQKINAKTYATVFAGSSSDKLKIGNYYKISGKLRLPFKVGNPSQFDYGRYLKNYNTFTVFYAKDSDCLNLNKKLSLKWQFMQSLDDLRDGIVSEHAKFLKSPNLEILGGVVFGDDAVTPPDYIKDAFVSSGILHILAASGMNVAIIYGIWFYILNKLRVPFNVTVISGIFVVVFYSLMTGLGASVVRAMLMLIFILIGKLFDRDAHSISLLSFVALLMLIYNPADINNVSFQLSFLVTFGLLTTAPAIFNKVNKMPNWLSGAIFIPVVAQIWVAPIQMFYFNTFSLYSVIVNILIVPFVSILSFGGFVSSVLALIKPIANPICFVFDSAMNPILNCIVAIPEFFAKLPHSLLITTQPNIIQLILYYGLVLAITLLIKYGKDKRLIAATVILFLGLVISNINIPNHNLETIAFDVQNADAFLIKTPENKYFLIDSAKNGYHGSKSAAQAIILSYLKDRGIKDIEGFIITHFDSDHSGGAVVLMQNLRVKKVYINSYTDKTRTSKKIYAFLKNHKYIKVEIPKNNEVIYSEKNLKIKTLCTHFTGKDSDNENGIVTLISDGKFDELFMADAGVKTFNKIKKYLPENIEVLKVGHHGGKDVVDKNMLKRITPEIGIVSTGPNNYGHPNPYTMYLLEHNGVKTYRTDLDNSIKVCENNNLFKAYAFSSEKYDYVPKSKLILSK